VGERLQVQAGPGHAGMGEGAHTCWSGCILRPTTRKELAVGLW
jgi:hypothetical protein